MKKLFVTMCVFVLTGFLSVLVYSADPKTEHAEMKKEHAKVHAEHDVLLGKIGKAKIEHRRALATLAEIQARILRHEAMLEELAEHAREHEDHIHHHDEEIAEHDKSGKDTDHAKLMVAHKAMIAEHTAIMKSCLLYTSDAADE